MADRTVTRRRASCCLVQDEEACQGMKKRCRQNNRRLRDGFVPYKQTSARERRGEPPTTPLGYHLPPLGGSLFEVSKLTIIHDST